MRAKDLSATELMQGDWVILDDIAPKRLCLGNIISIARGMTAEPIPLTEEILKANGFINHEDNGWKLFKLWEWSVEIHLYSEGSVIKISREIEGFKGVDDCHICYNNNVHQLQHALRLCGLDDLANKFIVK